MKKFTMLALLLVLTMAALTGCGCRNYAMPTTVPTTLPTIATTAPITAPTTAPTTLPTTATEPTVDYGNGPTTIATDPADARSVLPMDK